MSGFSRDARPARARRCAALLGAAIAFLLLAPAAGAAPAAGFAPPPSELTPATGDTLDAGTYLVSQSGRTARGERFSLTRLGDSLTVLVWSYYSRTGATTGDPDKRIQMLLSASDFSLHRYASEQVTPRDTLRRGIVIVGFDTAMTVYREQHGHGVGDKIAMPPGRFYVLDGPVFTPFNVIGRSFAGKSLDRREVSVLVLGRRDTVVTVTVVDRGRGSLRWNGRATTTRKLEISDRTAHYTGWYTLDGRMLRLERPEVGLVVQRAAPPRRPPAGRP